MMRWRWADGQDELRVAEDGPDGVILQEFARGVCTRTARVARDCGREMTRAWKQRHPAARRVPEDADLAAG